MTADKHEQDVRDFLGKADPGWVNAKDRGWHFDNPEQGDRYFEQIREQENPAFGPEPEDGDDSIEAKTYWAQEARAARIEHSQLPQPRLTAAQRTAKRMVELAQGSYGHLDVAELAEKALAPRPLHRRSKPPITKALAAYMLRNAFGVSEKRAAAILLGKPTKIHTDVDRAAQKLPTDFKARLRQMVEARIHRHPVIVGLPPKGTVSEKQPVGREPVEWWVPTPLPASNFKFKE